MSSPFHLRSHIHSLNCSVSTFRPSLSPLRGFRAEGEVAAIMERQRADEAAAEDDDDEDDDLSYDVFSDDGSGDDDDDEAAAAAAGSAMGAIGLMGGFDDLDDAEAELSPEVEAALAALAAKDDDF